MVTSAATAISRAKINSAVCMLSPRAATSIPPVMWAGVSATRKASGAPRDLRRRSIRQHCSHGEGAGDRPGSRRSRGGDHPPGQSRSEEHTSELQSRSDLVCRLLLEKKKKKQSHIIRQHAITTKHTTKHTHYNTNRHAIDQPS